MWEIIKNISEKLFSAPDDTAKTPEMTLSNASKYLSEALKVFSEESYEFYLCAEDRNNFEKASIEVDKSYEFYRQVVDSLQQKYTSTTTDIRENDAENVVDQLMNEGGVAVALGTDIAQEIDDWGIYAENFSKDGYTPELYFDGKITNMSLSKGENWNDNLMVIHFTFKDRDYILSFKTFSERFGKFAELELILNNKPAVKLDLYGNFEVEFVGEHDVGIQDWRVGKVRAITVGPWMKDVIDISSQLKANHENEYKQSWKEFNKSDITL